MDKDLRIKSEIEDILNKAQQKDKDIDLNLGKSPYQSREKELQDKNTSQNIDLRRQFSWAIYVFVVGFVAIVLLILCLSGFECVDFTLSDPILIGLITTMTTTIVGLLVFVLKYFFPQDKGQG